ncbi:MAG: hypothetical protein VYC17_04020 [Nitrospinota bacterium]|nr:hypothetical protein [Nitrospinota bacterium]
MNPHEESDNYVYEKLYEAIMGSITSSSEVKKILQNLQIEGRIDSMAVMNIILSLEELSGLIQSRFTHENGESAQPTRKDQGESIADNFDEAKWLKKVGIRF